MTKTSLPSNQMVELTSNKINKSIVPIQALSAKIKEAALNRNELFISYFSFPEDELKKHFEVKKTLASYKGNMIYRSTILDIDRREDTDAFCLQRAREFARRLNNEFDIPMEEIIFYFSGRGYHFHLPPVFVFEPTPHLQLIIRHNFSELFPECDSNPYSSVRGSIRLPNSFNEKSGLFKIPLDQDEFFTMDWQEIHDLAKEPRLKFKYPEQSHDLNLNRLISEVPKPAFTSKDNAIEGNTESAENVATCLSKMFHEGPTEGTRHQKALRIASGWRRAGIPREAVRQILTPWSTLHELEIKDIVDRTYESGYAYSCSDKLMEKYCDAKCIFYKKKNYVAEVVSMSKAEEAYVNYIRSDARKNMFNMNELWASKSYKTFPGEVIGITADTKLGKSTLVMNMIVKLKRMKSLYITMENGLNLTYRRFAQIAKGKSAAEVDEYYMQNTNTWSESFSHIDIVTLPPTLDHLRKMIQDHKPHIVVIDTLEDLYVKGVEDAVQKTGILAPQIKEIALQMNVIIICILHMNKSGTEDEKGKSRKPTLNGIKGLSSIKQKFDKLFSFYGDRAGFYRTLEIMAARDESNEFKLELLLDDTTMRIFDVKAQKTNR